MPATSAPDWTRPCVAHLRRVWAHPGLINTGARLAGSRARRCYCKQERAQDARGKCARQSAVCPRQPPGRHSLDTPRIRIGIHAPQRTLRARPSRALQGTPVPRECLSTTVMGRNESEHRHKGLKGRAVSAASAHVQRALWPTTPAGIPSFRSSSEPALHGPSSPLRGSHQVHLHRVAAPTQPPTDSR
jgi:hypothetical protein